MKYSSLRSGDLLVWGKSSRKSSFLNTFKLVRLFTMSNYGHVSVAWVAGSTVMHVEAVQPRIQITKLREGEDVYVIPMGLNLSHEDMMNFFGDKIGLPYSMMDAFRAWAGLTMKDPDKWQCAELAYDFYESVGVKLPLAHTPSRLVRAILEIYEKPLYKLNNLRSA